MPPPHLPQTNATSYESVNHFLSVKNLLQSSSSASPDGSGQYYTSRPVLPPAQPRCHDPAGGPSHHGPFLGLWQPSASGSSSIHENPLTGLPSSESQDELTPVSHYKGNMSINAPP